MGIRHTEKLQLPGIDLFLTEQSVQALLILIITVGIGVVIAVRAVLINLVLQLLELPSQILVQVREIHYRQESRIYMIENLVTLGEAITLGYTDS